jgi:hypothetical protein
MLLSACALITTVSQARAEQISLTVGQAEEMFSALRTISEGRDVLIKGPPQDRVVKIPYQFSSPILIAMYHNMAELRPTIEVFQQAHDNRLNQLRDDKGKLPVEAERTITEETIKMQAETHNFDLTKIKLKDLLSPDNSVAPALLVALRPSLDEGN